MERKAGVLMHISSLPNDRGIGSFGKSAYEFIDFLNESKITYWQVLPLCPTSYGDSPYQSPSAFAGNPYFIDLDILIEQGLLTKDQSLIYKMGRVDYSAIYKERFDTLAVAFENFKSILQTDIKLQNVYSEFKLQNKKWLEPYAYFMTIKSLHDGAAWYDWQDDYKFFKKCDFSKLNGDAEFWNFVQYKFFEQWGNLKAYAIKRGVKIIGDMPIYVAYDSVDVWANPELFLLDDNLVPKVVAGVPPDDFSSEGQLWGNPVYDWDLMKAQGFRWWIERLRQASEIYDIVRIDHFRGFESYYCIPYNSPNAKNGEWKKGAGTQLFRTINATFDNPFIIAEDLGVLDDDVLLMLKQTGYPGMKILQFAFDGNLANEYLHTNYNENCVAYTGTHDNDTTKGWFKKLENWQKDIVKNTLNYHKKNISAKMIRCLFESKADLVVIPIQDFLNLSSRARMNMPSTMAGNWQWRSKPSWKKLAPKIAKLCQKYNRN